MKKIMFILFLALVNGALFSCTPRSLSDEGITKQACCGEEEPIPPPPPPTGSNGG